MNSLNEHQEKHFKELVKTVKRYCTESKCGYCDFYNRETKCEIGEPHKWNLNRGKEQQ